MKLAIINGNDDILRIIPHVKKDRIDFKFTLMDNNFNLNYWYLGLKEPKSFTTSSEITYHSSDEEKKPVIHVKHKGSEVIYSHRFSKVTDIHPNTYFPIPLCKISIKGNFSRKYKRKNDHQIFNFHDEKLNSANCVEIYIISKNSGGSFMDDWPYYSLLFQISTIDYLVKGPSLSKQFLEWLYSGPNVAMEMNLSFSKFNILFKPYYEKGIKDNTISFYENNDYFSILSCSPIQLMNGISKAPLSKIAPAYAFDLEYQYKHGIPKNELDGWKLFFDTELKRVLKYYRYPQIFLIPQYPR